jgi:ubiquinone/menaquinone biosynthesis C-methylase UbiE
VPGSEPGDPDAWKHVYEDPAFAARYAEKRARGASSRKREAAEAALVERALARVTLPPGARVLDCPSGTGRFSALLAARGLRVTASDIALEMLRHGAAEPGVAPVLADALRLPFPDRTFELVLCVRLLHHVPTREARRALLRELARVAKGHVLVSFFHAVSFHEVRDRLTSLWRPFDKTRHAITLGTLAADAGASGLSVEATFPLLRYVKRQWFALLSTGRPRS